NNLTFTSSACVLLRKRHVVKKIQALREYQSQWHRQFMAGLPLHMGNQTEATVVAKLAGLMKTSVHGRASKTCFIYNGTVVKRKVFGLISLPFLVYLGCKATTVGVKNG
ncbi:MAG: hypothetical protein R6U42_09705, partial [Halomonas sp.]